MTSEAPSSFSSGVLIVDPSADCREVLATLLQRRGVQTWEAEEAGRAVELTRQHRPDVVVLDMDAEAASDAVSRLQNDREATGDPAALVFLGRARCLGVGPSPDRVIAKPYHYAPLIRTIEQLLRR